MSKRVDASPTLQTTPLTIAETQFAAVLGGILAARWQQHLRCEDIFANVTFVPETRSVDGVATISGP